MSRLEDWQDLYKAGDRADEIRKDSRSLLWSRDPDSGRKARANFRESFGEVRKVIRAFIKTRR